LCDDSSSPFTLGSGTTGKDSAQKDKVTTLQDRPVADKAVAGGSFNKFFRVLRRVMGECIPRRKGFCGGKVEKGSKDVAMLSISDIASNLSAAYKYKQSTQQIAGYPAVNQGKTATSILVGDRYQVKVLSRDPNLQSDRVAWLQNLISTALLNLNNHNRVY
jgi:hypothetical protein